jgi:Secretion system C-terminal sorting domain
LNLLFFLVTKTLFNNLKIKTMKKITLLLLFAIASVFAQQKSTGTINLHANMSANFTLNNTTSKVTLVLTGPSDRWFGLGIGVAAGFGMGAGDVLVYTTSLSDRNFAGQGSPNVDGFQDWTTVSNTVSGLIRTLTLTRNLTNTDAMMGADYQMPYATTTSFSIVGVRASNGSTSLGGHGGNASASYATATFSLLGTQDFSLNATEVFPNPSNGSFTVKTKSGLDKINVYSQVGAFVKTINVNSLNATEVNLKDLSSGVYLIELKNANDNSWKKIIVN